MKNIKNGKKNKMNEQMMKEILEDWLSWKYDILDMNKSEWNTRDESKLQMITIILEEKLKQLQGKNND